MRRWPLLFLLLLFACAEEDPIARVVKRVTDAAEDRDAAAVMKHVSASYERRADVELELRRYFFAYKNLDVTVRNLQSTISGSEAFATFDVDLSGTPKQLGGMDQYLPRQATLRFDVTLAEEGGEWKITSARWQRIGSSGS